MRHLYLSTLCTFFLFNINLFAQENCEVSNALETLDANNLVVEIPVEGDLWWNRSDGSFDIFVNGFTGPNNLLGGVAAPWIAAIDDNGVIRTAAQTYGASNNDSEFFAGPLNPLTGTTEANMCENFSRHWKVNRADVETHLNDFVDNGVIDGPVPTAILEWPGRENPEAEAALGFALPAQSLAPFVDQNNNGIYEPLEGDHPEMKGDQMIWWVFNDDGPFDDDLGVEVQALAYAFAESNSSLAYTHFYEYKFINRSGGLWTDTYSSLWFDFDGCSFPSSLGCDTLENMAYYYNEDSNFTTGGDCICASFPLGECFEYPMLGIKVLDGPVGELGEDQGFSSFVFINNAGVGTPPIGTTDPDVAIEFYNYMQGKWRDGSPLTYGGDGYDPNGEPTNYVYPSPPNSTLSGAWSMCSEASEFLDRRSLINSGPFNLEPGEEANISYAVLVAFPEEYPCPDISPLIEAGETATDAYHGILNKVEERGGLSGLDFSPNPMFMEGRLTVQQDNLSLESVELFSTDGKLQRIYSEVGNGQLVIERKGLRPGVYFLKCLLSNGQWVTKKMMVH